MSNKQSAMTRFGWYFGSALVVLAVASAASAQDASGSVKTVGPEAESASGVDEIIVTAQKREQKLNDVGMSITALSGADLLARGVNSVADLSKVVPGFVYTPTGQATPVYTIRGVGFYDTSLQAPPAVTVYVDEVPLPYSAMTTGVDLDLERVEVLKGPQGTVFGNNSTGGAINFIAAKPTDSFHAGLDASYERFNTASLGGFVSGPVSDTISVRIAARGTIGGDWQKSYTSGLTLGEQLRYQGRVLVDFHPTDRLKFMLNVNGWVDKSDPQAFQTIAIRPNIPATVDPAVASYPLAPANARAADFIPGFDKRNNSFYQFALRGSYELSDSMTFTSITSYSKFKGDTAISVGFPFINDPAFLRGNIRSFSQEARISGKLDRLNWVVGGNYSNDKIYDEIKGLVGNASTRVIIPGLPIAYATGSSASKVRTIAGFANAEYELIDNVSVLGGIRYTDDRRTLNACDVGDPNLQTTFEILQTLFKGGSFIPIGPTDCYILHEDFNPGPVHGQLKQHNVSWRAGVNWKPSPTLLLYANISQGYKAGSFPTLSAATSVQFKPVIQEKVLAYEAGFKAGLFDRRLQINAAAFYYDYGDKQLKAKIQDIVFGALDSLVNIPKSRLWGLEAQINAAPVPGLDLSLGGTYLNSKIKGSFTTFPLDGAPQVDVGGNAFPYTPKIILVGDGQYRWALGGNDLSMFVGGGFTHNSRTTADIGNAAIYSIRAFTTVDLRAGLIGPSDKWRLTVFGKNITNAYYWTNVAHRTDNIIRLAARPATYGVSFAYRY